MRTVRDTRAHRVVTRADRALHDEETAFRIEAAVIDLFGLDALTNEVRDWRGANCQGILNSSIR